MFETAKFIKSPDPFVREFDKEKSPCYIFRKRFTIDKPRNTRLSVCGLGYAYYYLNGQRVSEDLFTAPVSDYNKTLWVNTYEVDHLLKIGDNVLTVIVGNGFFNEAFKTTWGNCTATYRDNPKVILTLENGGETILCSNDTWLCAPYTPIVYNHLRSGEHFDARLFDKRFADFDFDDTSWPHAVIDDQAPRGSFRECPCQPIRECAEYTPVNILKTGERKYVFDMGQNMSGYVRLHVKQRAGDQLVIRYAEAINEDGSLNLCNASHHYVEGSEYMTDKFICNGEEFTWSPRFTYHGFRYIEIDGLDEATPDTAHGIFVHQDVRALSGFECSDTDLNDLYRMGQIATLSNVFYMPTDCPTREKFGWANDAQASAEQMLTNFDMADLFRKWNTDILDAMREDGCLPGIIPTHGWGYDWGNGPVSDGCLFEIPYQVYRYTADDSLLKRNLPYFARYFNFLKTKQEADGMVHFGLTDWCPPEKPSKVPSNFINSALIIHFLRITILAAERSGADGLARLYRLELGEAETAFKANFLDDNGACRIDEQTAVAMVIYYDLFNALAPLKAQLQRLVEERDFHHNCGMVGLRRLFAALNKCGLDDYAYRILTARGYPSFLSWKEAGATALCEKWEMDTSQNHHMFSDFMLWMIKTLAGINLVDGTAGYERITIKPVFIKSLTYCRGYTETPYGIVRVGWNREADNIRLEITVPDGVTATCPYAENGILAAGSHRFTIPTE